VYSKIRGNATNDPEAVEPQMTPPDPNVMVNFEGRLVNDPTLAWKVVAGYNMPFDIHVGGFFRHESGDTWTSQILITGLNQGPFTVNGLPRGSNRLPSKNIFDLRLEKMFPISSGQLHLTADIFNVFNSAYVTGVDDQYGSPTYEQPIASIEPRTVRLGVRFSF
jgi:hypothetical protein